MSISELKGQNVDVKLWTPLDEVEGEALTQLRKVTTLPTVFHHVAVMPDCHAGKGSTVGSVIATKGSISPATVGVDIGCGMGAVKTNLRHHQIEDLAGLRSRIEAAIPTGFNSHDVENTVKRWEGTKRSYEKLFADFKNLTSEVQHLDKNALKQVGTLGGGNHFIELCVDTQGDVWMMLHSGSRNIGNKLALAHMAKAQKLGHNHTVDPDLAYFLSQTPEMEAYRHDLYWAQRYAFLNRQVMFELYKAAMQEHFAPLLDELVLFSDPILCHHNYVAEEVHYGEEVFVTRKGAINAERGTLGIIPGSMGAKSFIVRGLGNPESFNSASHGAGRKMSRNAARKRFTVADLKEQTQGIEGRKDEKIVDEIPGAYKDIEKVMENQRDLVEVVYELKQVMYVKGD